MPAMQTSNYNKMFWFYLIGALVTYGILVLITYLFSPYKYFPGYGFIGYGLVIGLLLVALNYAGQRSHYLCHSLSLIVFGAIASLDMILSKQELAEIWVLWDWFPLTMDHINGYMQTLIILLNIFTGSVAANSLFYGLNRRNFE